jgi:hypothetical protein
MLHLCGIDPPPVDFESIHISGELDRRQAEW